MASASWMAVGRSYSPESERGLDRKGDDHDRPEAEAVGKEAVQRAQQARCHGTHHRRRQDQRARQVEGGRGVGQHVDRNYVEGRVLRDPHEQDRKDIAGLPQRGKDRCPLPPYTAPDVFELRRLRQVAAHPEPDADEHDADQERDAPAPAGQLRVAEHAGERRESE